MLWCCLCLCVVVLPLLVCCGVAFTEMYDLMHWFVKQDAGRQRTLVQDVNLPASNKLKVSDVLLDPWIRGGGGVVILGSGGEGW